MMRGSNATGGEVLAAALQRHGVTEVFGQSIPSAFFLAAPKFGIRQIGYRTENAGCAMADAYARLSHRVGVVAAQNGPAATLLVPGLAEALKASVPIVAIVQDVSSRDADRNAFQELDHLELFRGCTKWVRRIGDVQRIDDYVDMAFAAAATGRPGPAVLLMPQDILAESTAASGVRTESLGNYPLDRVLAEPARVESAADLIAAAERPLVIAGGGVHLSGACAALARLQEEIGLPVATTSMGKGSVDERHPLSVGVVGYFMARHSRTHHLKRLAKEADVILLVGTRTNQNGTDNWALLPASARLIHIDADGQEVGRNYEAFRLVGDARLTLTALREAMQRRDLTRRARTRGQVEAVIREGRRRWVEDITDVATGNSAPVRPELIMHEADRLLTAETVVVADASYASIWVNNYLTALAPGMRFLTPRGLAGLGWGLPFALGAKVAFPAAPILCFTGDGGFAHVWSELETARRMNLPIAVIVLNNQSLAYQKHAEIVMFGTYSDACSFTPVDHAAIARACGCAGMRVTHGEAVRPALQAALGANVPTVIDIVTDPEAVPPITVFADSPALSM